MFNDRLVVDPLEKSRNDVNENVYPFAEVQQYNSTILDDSGVMYPCNVDIPL